MTERGPTERGPTEPGPLGEIVAFLAERHELERVDGPAGRYLVVRDGVPVSIELTPSLVGEYLAQLGADAVPGLGDVPAGEQLRLRARALARLVDELVDSDVFGSLRALLLERRRGAVWLQDVRGPETHRRPGAAGGGSWTADRSSG